MAAPGPFGAAGNDRWIATWKLPFCSLITSRLLLKLPLIANNPAQTPGVRKRSKKSQSQLGRHPKKGVGN